jgi:hypothetical protein
MVEAVCLHERYAQIMEAYVAALDGRDPETVDIGELLPGIFKAFPAVAVTEIREALMWASRRCAREADALEAEGRRREGL